jgi:hypothetical protein
MAHGFLRRLTNFAGGISAGGGDTTWDRTQQPTFLSRIVRNAPVTAVLPKGTVLLERWVIPHPDLLPTVGTINIDDVAGAVSYGVALPANMPDRTSFLTTGALSTDTRFTFTPTGLDGAAYVGFLVIIPKTRD